MSIEAMKQMVEALEVAEDSVGDLKALEIVRATIASSRQAIAEAEKQEPDDLTIAYMSGLSRGKELAAQPKREPLTDEQIIDLWPSLIMHQHTYAFARAIEAAHGIKGEA